MTPPEQIAYGRERVEGDRKVRVRVGGRDARAMQDAIEHLVGDDYLEMRRRESIAKRLRGVVERYRLMDESDRKARGRGDEK